MSGETKPKRGRPKKNPSEVKRHNVTIAMAEPIRTAIGEAAERNGRSISSEIDFRLGMSLALDEDTGSPSVRRLIDFTRLAAAKLQEDSGQEWIDSRDVAVGLSASILSYIATNSPEEVPIEELQRKLDNADTTQVSIDKLMEQLLALKDRIEAAGGKVDDETGSEIIKALREIARLDKQHHAVLKVEIEAMDRGVEATDALRQLFQIKRKD